METGLGVLIGGPDGVVIVYTCRSRCGLSSEVSLKGDICEDVCLSELSKSDFFSTFCFFGLKPFDSKVYARLPR